MKIGVAITAVGLAAVAACGSNSGNGDSVTTNSVTTKPTPNQVCESAPGSQVCGPGATPSVPPSTAVPTSP
ncbi:MAG TPA: hypothetical protein VHB18_07170 [Mycobacteriales bacterium]|nr:hypothetical protein [Mycobacteriales bacterium]